MKMPIIRGAHGLIGPTDEPDTQLWVDAHQPQPG